MVCKTQLTIRENKNAMILEGTFKSTRLSDVCQSQLCLFNDIQECLYRSDPSPRSMIQPGFLSHQVERKNLPGFGCNLSPSIQVCSPDVLVEEAASPKVKSGTKYVHFTLNLRSTSGPLESILPTFVTKCLNISLKTLLASPLLEAHWCPKVA